MAAAEDGVTEKDVVEGVIVTDVVVVVEVNVKDGVVVEVNVKDVVVVEANVKGAVAEVIVAAEAVVVVDETGEGVDVEGAARTCP